MLWKSDIVTALPPLWNLHWFLFFPPLQTHTIPPTHSMRAIISAVAGSNKAVTAGRRLETVSAKSHYLTEEAHRQRHRNQNITVKVESAFIWVTSRGLRVNNSGLPLTQREGGMPAHQSVNSSTEVGRLHLSLSKLFKLDSWLPETFIPTDAETHCKGLTAD